MINRLSLSLLAPTLALAVAMPAHADDRDRAITGALIGSVAGAVIGHRIGGRDAAVVGGAVGAATGVAVATSPRGDSGRDVRYSRDSARDAYVYGDDDDDRVDVRARVDYDEPYVRERVVYQQPVVYQAPPTVIYRPAPVVVYRDAPVYYQPVRQVVRYDLPDRGWHRGWDRGWDKHREHEYKEWRHRHDRDDD